MTVHRKSLPRWAKLREHQLPMKTGWYSETPTSGIQEIAWEGRIQRQTLPASPTTTSPTFFKALSTIIFKSRASSFTTQNIFLKPKESSIGVWSQKENIHILTRLKPMRSVWERRCSVLRGQYFHGTPGFSCMFVKTTAFSGDLSQAKPSQPFWT